MKAKSAPLQLCNCREEHMDKCVFVIIRPWSFNIMVVTNMKKPVTICGLLTVDITDCVSYSVTLGWFAGRTFKIHCDTRDRLNRYVILLYIYM
jgi:hypothetical protein